MFIKTYRSMSAIKDDFVKETLQPIPDPVALYEYYRELEEFAKYLLERLEHSEVMRFGGDNHEKM